VYTEGAGLLPNLQTNRKAVIMSFLFEMAYAKAQTRLHDSLDQVQDDVLFEAACAEVDRIYHTTAEDEWLHHEAETTLQELHRLH
jgi:hypothetical protein